MLHYTTISRIDDEALPRELALLDAPVVTADEEEVGLIDGVIVDDRDRIVAFLVHLEGMGHFRAQRVVVPLRALEIGRTANERTTQPYGGGSWTPPTKPIVRIRWTTEQLREEPNFARDDRLPEVDGHVPPGLGFKRSRAFMDLVKGAGIGGAIGFAIGVVTGSLPVMAATAVFFGFGGGLAGIIRGEGSDSAADAADLGQESGRKRPGSEAIRSLERALKEASFEGRYVHRTPITPLSQAKLGRQQERTLER
jgi:hypothetical protein